MYVCFNITRCVFQDYNYLLKRRVYCNIFNEFSTLNIYISLGVNSSKSSTFLPDLYVIDLSSNLYCREIML